MECYFSGLPWTLSLATRWRDLSLSLSLCLSGSHQHWQMIVAFVLCFFLSPASVNCSCFSYTTSPHGHLCMELSWAPVLSDATAEEASSGACSQSHQPCSELWCSPLWLNGRNLLFRHVRMCMYVLVCRSAWGLPWRSNSKEFSCQCRRFDPRIGEIPYAVEQISPRAMTTERALFNKKSQHCEKPAYCNLKVTLTRATRESPGAAPKTQHSHR